MAESINLKKRLIGKEDINFDIAGTGETENFITADGDVKTLTKVNAAHFPLTRESREKLNATNVDEALNLISDKVDNFEANDALTEDVTVSFLPEDDIETIQNKINQQKRNLSGHTISFLFPVSIAQNLYDSLVWQDFYNGTVVIAGGSEGNRIAVYDRQNTDALFKIYRCQCEVRIEYFHFVHQYSIYAVSAKSSSAVILKGCQFSGMAGASSAAVHHINSSHTFIDCEFYEDEKSDPVGLDAYLPLAGGTMTGAIRRVVEGDENSEVVSAENRTSGHVIWFGIGAGNENRGIYDVTTNSWLIGFDENGNLMSAGKKVLTEETGAGYPNYTSGVDVTGSYKSGWTASTDGWVGICVGSDNTGGIVFVSINGVEVGRAQNGGGTDDYIVDSFLFPVKKDDKITYGGNATLSLKWLKYFPNR